MLFIWVQCLIATFAVLILLVFVQDKPPSPPSLSATIQESQFDFKREFNTLVKNKNYVLLTIGFSCFYANTATLSAVVSALTSPFGFGIKDNAIFGASFILCGIIGSALVGALIDKYPRFRKTLVLLGSAGTLFFFLCFFAPQSHSVLVLALNFGAIGLFAIPILPVCFAFAVELTYPMPEAMSNGMMLLPSKIYGAILGVIAGHLAEINPLYTIFLFMLNTAITTIAALFIKEDLRRINMTAEARE
jgi:MFS family permease